MKLKSFLTACVFGCAFSVAAATEISVYVGQKSGGGAAAMQLLIAEELQARGWKVDFKIIGNCGQVKELMKSKKPILSGWQASWIGQDKTCDVPLTADRFAGIFTVTPWFLCGPTNNMQFTLEKNKTYRVGANAGQNHDVMLKALGQRLDINFKLIEYKNSGGIDQALAAGEIDAAWSNSGYREYIEKNKRCFYTTSAQPIAGIVPLDSVLQGKYTKAVYLAFWTVSESWVPSELSKLKKDLESIYNGDKFQKLIQIRGSYIPQLSISDQIQLIKDVSEAF